MKPLTILPYGGYGAVFCILGLDFFLRWIFAKTCNPGVSFGFMLPLSELWTSSVLLLIVLWLWKREKKLLEQNGLFLLLAGGLGNLLDRAIFGCVRDYLSIPFFPIFPTFNLSDIVLSLGVFLWVLGAIRGRDEFREA